MQMRHSENFGQVLGRNTAKEVSKKKIPRRADEADPHRGRAAPEQEAEIFKFAEAIFKLIFLPKVR